MLYKPERDLKGLQFSPSEDDYCSQLQQLP